MIPVPAPFPLSVIKRQIIRLEYRNNDDLKLEFQQPFVDAIRRASRTGEVGLMAIIHLELKWVDLEIPKFWIRQLSSNEMKVARAVVVGGRLSVRAAATAFNQAAQLAGMALRVQCHDNETKALAWLESELGLR
jgi:hypothetical protein